MSSQSVRPGWRWGIRRWRSERPSWGVEILKRPMLKHSQIRINLGRRHLTLQAWAVGKGRGNG